ncbi:hypothetical protein HK100_002815 [Physocladia obscura]|uniref:MARVEL domain-containing protein n=1 Tax=Physocladia obscura TaxID=109957 RepID=A0AAD5XG39_9FUNG|nr:hypothetical protein HK100_002815 [Physocladia obscura]
MEKNINKNGEFQIWTAHQTLSLQRQNVSKCKGCTRCCMSGGNTDQINDANFGKKHLDSIFKLASYRALRWNPRFTTGRLSAIIVLAGIADQARYGPSSICILYIQDYKQDSQNPGYYLFNANSSACSGIMGLSAASMLLALIIGAASLYYIIRAEFRAVRLIFGMAVIAIVETLISFLMAIVATIGINTTCGQFAGAGFSCSTIFSGGFFEQETSLTYPKTLATINAAVAFSWICCLSWAAYAALEVLNWRNSV